MTSTWSIGVGSPWKKLSSTVEIGGVERLRAQRADLGRCLLEPVRVTAGEDDVGALGAGQPRGLQPDARAAADHDDCLPGQLRLAHCGSSVPACSAAMYAAYQSGQFASACPVRSSCLPCAAAARRSPAARSATEA